MARLRTTVDVIATVLVATAAGVLLWRTSETEHARGSEPRPQVERLDASGLYTDLVDAVTKGDPMATVVLIEYADFQCPFCKRFAKETFDRLDQRFVSTGLVQYAYRHYPLAKVHPVAMEAARAAECAFRNGRFWEMREELFANQDDMASLDWLELASRLGMDERRFEQCVSDDETQRSLDQQVAGAERLGVSSTPTFLIGARGQDGMIHVLTRIRGAYPYEVFEGALEEVLASAKQAASSVSKRRHG